MVALGKVDVGPFKNAIVIYVYRCLTESIDTNMVFDKNELLVPPIITDGSCWKKGYFTTYKKLEPLDMDIYTCHFFKNSIRNEIYDQHGCVISSVDDGIPVGEEAINFYRNVIKNIENALNELR